MTARWARPASRGFTLIEVLIALSVFFLVLAGLFQLFDPSNVMYTAGQRKVDSQQGTRVGMDGMTRQLRMTGYLPENNGCPTPRPAAAPPCPAALVAPVAVQIATDTALAVLGDLDNSGVSNVFLFCLNNGQLTVVKSALTPGTFQAAPTGYVCGNGQPVADNVTNIRFAYYDVNHNPVPNPVPPAPYALDGQPVGAVPGFANTVQRTAVRTVVLTLTAQEAVPGQQPITYTLSSDVRLRNLN